MAAGMAASVKYFFNFCLFVWSSVLSFILFNREELLNIQQFSPQTFSKVFKHPETFSEILVGGGAALTIRIRNTLLILRGNWVMLQLLTVWKRNIYKHREIRNIEVRK